MRRIIAALGRLPSMGLVLVLSLFTLVPLALLAYLTLSLAGAAVRHEVETKVRAAAAVSARLTQREMSSLGELVDSYASRPSLIHALTPRRPDRRALDVHLRDLQHRKAIATAALTDPGGRLIAARPAAESSRRRNAGGAHWYRGVTETGGPYVSEAFRASAPGRPAVVAVAVPVHAAGGGRVVGLLVATYRLDSLGAFARNLAGAEKIALTITDRRGTVVAGSRTASVSLESSRGDPLVAAALRGESGIVEHQGDRSRLLSAFAPVAGIGWTVTADVPADAAFAANSTLRSTVLSIAATLGLVLLGGLILLALVLRERRAVEASLRDSEEHTRSILDAAKDAFISMSDEGCITGWNAQAEHTFGWSHREALGRRLSETIIPVEYREAHERGVERFLATGEGPVLDERVEITALHRDGHLFPVELGIWAIPHDHSFRFNAFVHDISGRKRAERELEAAHDQALEASRLKSEFLANMSHEIRTPMNGVVGMTSLMLATEMTSEQREYADTIRRSADSLLTVINDILDFSKIEAGRMDLEVTEFDLRTVVEEVAELVAGRAHERGLELATLIPAGVPTTVRGDAARVRQILLNLVSNAIKFTKEGEVVVRVETEEISDAGALLRFEVSDTGMGLTPEQQDRIFESFTQGDASSTRRFGGTGLGLAISKKLAEIMGGAIGVDSEAGRGSKFWFTVRVARGSETEVVAPRHRPSLRGLRVLVVDDNATNRAILEQSLCAWGMVPATASGAQQGLDLLRESIDQGRAFAAALIDFQMPGMDGIELARTIASEPGLSDVRLVLLTSVTEQSSAREAHEAGIDAYLTKPVRHSALYDSLATILGLEDRTQLVTAHKLAEARFTSRARILVAEDNVVNQKVAARLLEKMGLRADVASNGREAVEAVTGTDYAAVLMDCQMPELDGYEATIEIRKLPGSKRKTPIVAMTAGAMKGDEEKAMAAGMDGYLTKPVRAEDLAAALRRWIALDDEATGEDVGDGTPDLDGDGHGDGHDEPTIDGAILGRLQALDDDGGGELGELVGSFIENAAANLEALYVAAGEGDAARVSLLAHSMKGSVGTLGARRLMRLCVEAQARADHNEVPTREQLLELSREFDRVSVAVGAASAQARPPTRGGGL